MKVSLRTSIIRMCIDDRCGPPLSVREACLVFECSEAQLRERVLIYGQRAGVIESGRVISIDRTWVLSQLSLDRSKRIKERLNW